MTLLSKTSPRYQYNLVISTTPSGQSRLFLTGSTACGGSGQVTLDSSFTSWSGLTITYDGATLRLYSNGRSVGSAALPVGTCATRWAAGALQLGGQPWGASGLLLDELALYPTTFTAPQVAAQFRDPLVKLSFDGLVGDSSLLRQPVSVGGQPTVTMPNSRSGNRAAAFDKQRWVTVGPSPTLDLSSGSGQFTLATWLRPVPLYPDFGQWVGVMGRESGGSGDYPSLYANFSNSSENGTLKVAFGNGATKCESAATGAWLTPGTWQHVAVSYTGTQFVFYRNGVLQEALPLPGACSGAPVPQGGDRFYVGRTSPAGMLSINSIQVIDEGDGAGSAEYRAFWNKEGYSDSSVWSNELGLNHHAVPHHQSAGDV